MAAPQAQSPIDPEIFDTSVFAFVKDTIPPERLNEYLSKLACQLESMEGLSSADGPALKEQAHQIVSQAGMLGLMRLSSLARVLENACIAGREQTDALRDCCQAADDISHYAIPAVSFPIE